MAILPKNPIKGKSPDNLCQYSFYRRASSVENRDKDLAGRSPQPELVYLPKFGGRRDNPLGKLRRHLKGSAAAGRFCYLMEEPVTAVTRCPDSLTPECVFEFVA